MKNRFLVLFSIVIFSGYSAINALAQAAAPETVKSPGGQFASETHFEPGKGVLITEAAKITAVVLSVDKQDRSIVVKGPDGKAQKIELTEDVKNFDQIHPGDELVVEDLGSSNGTVVNGKLVVGKQTLRHKDEMRLHDIVFRVTESFSRTATKSGALNETTVIKS